MGDHVTTTRWLLDKVKESLRKSDAFMTKQKKLNETAQGAAACMHMQQKLNARGRAELLKMRK